MKKNESRVEKLKAELINEIKDWFVGKTDVTMVEFRNSIPIQLIVDTSDLDFDDYTIETIVVNYLTSDGYVTDGEDEEHSLESLSITEVESVLDQLQSNKINLIIETE